MRVPNGTPIAIRKRTGIAERPFHIRGGIHDFGGSGHGAAAPTPWET